MRTIVGAALVAVQAVTPALAGQPDDFDRYGPGMMGWDGGWSMMIFGPFMMVLTLVVLVAAIVVAVRWLGGPWHSPGWGGPTVRRPQDILKERFARGEIDKAEYEERSRVLGD